MASDDAYGASFRPSTLVDLLRGRAAGWPDRLAYVYLEDGENETRRVTFAQLDAWARAIAALLQDENIAGERALLLYPPGLDFIAAFFGCLYAGVVAVPAYPPRRNRPSPRIQGIVADARPKIALTTGQILSDVGQRFEQAPDLAALRWMDTEGVKDDTACAWRPTGVSPETLAFLQYTSGSTGAPKGVMVSHSNLIHNLEMIRQGFQIDSQARGVFWLPNYHDMGLIGGILEPMYINGHSILMPPAAFLQRPVRWLRVLSRYQGNITGAPNFAYQMCVDKVTAEQCEGLDLSCWEIAFCGAEPIRPETLQHFAERFAPYGFRSNAFYPCYGLAEATLLASGGDGPSSPTTFPVQSGPLTQRRAVTATPDDDETQTFVSCGRALLDQEIVIVDPDTLMGCDPGEIGEVWIAGASVAQGYWDRPEESKRTFHAYRADNGAGPYLRTGDLGFFDEGELYLAGRLKDLIIIRGRNHYPQDIEATVAESHLAFEPSMGAAFSVMADGQERLVVTHELQRSHRHADVDEVTAAARQAIAEVHGLQPHAVVLLRPLSIPKTSSGKVKRHACKAGFLDGSLKEIGRWQATSQTAEASAQRPRSALQPSRRAAEIEAWLVEKIVEHLPDAVGAVDPERPFVEYGLDSVQAVALAGDLETWLGRSLSPTLIWDYPSIAALSRHLAGEEVGEQESVGASSSSPTADEPVAVIGLGCRFPGADGPDAFWHLLRDGIDAIDEVPAGRWDADALYDAEGAPGKMTTRWGGFLDEVDRFDPHFFGISPREAARMDPQQRLLLEVVWEALEHAGFPPGRLAGSQTGVFVGISSYDYSRLQFSDPAQIDAYAGTGNAHSVAANRLSYLLDLRGPSLAVDTACSSSLVAAHLAVQSLRSGESDLALVGGVNLLLSPELTITFSQARMMAADGRCKTFDARADGYVRGEGAGVVVLKRLSDALRDGDNVLAVLRGSAVNQDGRSNGLTAPHGPSQQAVIRQALANAGVSPASLSYVEAHGTGTPLGDPIEVQSLRAVLEEDETPKRCYLGSVKTNVGHLESAAGVAGLIKVVLALHHQEIPPHLHFQELNPYISLDGSPLQIATESRPWPREGQPRLAGISSFGFGGTNAHLIIGDWPLEANEEAAAQAPAEQDVVQLLPLSAKNETALRALAGRYAAFLQENGDISLADLCYTAAAGRDHFTHRAAFTAGERDALLTALQQFTEQAPANAPPQTTPGPIAFLFTGQGAQYPDMARRLYESEPVFRATLDRCAELLRPHLEHPLLSVLFTDGEQDKPAPDLLDETAYTQPALFAVEYALAELWRSWRIEPDVVLGHSVGEYVAACIAGVFSLEDGLRLIAARGRLMQQLPRDGAMAVIFASEERVVAALEPYADRVAVAAVNGPDNVTISGAADPLAAVLEKLEAQGVETRSLSVSHAFHSPLMDPVLEPFAAIARTVAFQPSRLSLVSNVTGRLFEEGETPDADYWREHVRRPVRFADSMQALADTGASIFLEVSPQPHLLGMGRRALSSAEALWLPSLRRGRADDEVLRGSLSALYEAGADVDWEGVYADRRRRKVPLPTYPFERERYWLDVTPTSSFATSATNDGVQRLPTAVPLYQAQLDLSRLETAAHEALHAVAADYWGDGDHDVDLMVKSSGPTLSSQTTVQVALAPQAPDIVACQLFYHDEAAGEWRLVAAGQLRHGEAGQQPAVEEAGDNVVAFSPDDEPAPIEDVQSYLRAQTAAVLGLEPGRLPLEQPLDGLGMDSLMAIELRNRLESDLNVTLPAVVFLQGPTVLELVEQIQARLDDGESDVEAITPVLRAPGDPLPLSHGQQAMWFLHQLLPDDWAFNVAGAVRLIGLVDAAALRRALQQTVDRHPALRTTFSVERGRPAQRTQLQVPAPFTEVDASAWSEEKLQTYLDQTAYRPFDLEAGAPLRMVLLRRAPREHVLLLSVSHIVADFWSISLLVQELSLAYQAETEGSDISLPPLPLDYGDYVLWQREMLSGPEGERLRDYWRQQLGGELPLLDLPTDHPRGAEQTFRGEIASRRLDPGLTAGLRTLSQTHGATLSMTLLAAFQALLHRYTGQEDLLVGSVVAGRERPELARLVGYFINPVAMRADFSGDPTFASFLEQARQTVLDAFAHQDYPLPLLAQDLSLTRDPGRPPLFETMFIMQKAQVMEEQGLSALALGLPGAQMELGELRVESMGMDNLPAQFDLTLMMAELDESLAAALHYNRDLFEPETAERMLEHLEALLRVVVDYPHRPLSAVPLLSAGERERLLVDWNRTTAPYPRHKCLHQLIQEQAARTPERVAAEVGGRQLTYSQLNERANQLAHTLREQGVARGDLVGVAVERSLEMLVAVLGVLKAGGAYVPLDPDFPPARLALMLEDARPKILLTEERLASVLEDAAGEAGVLCLDADREEIEKACRHNVESGARPEDLAYVIYTSGSTGRPKGVQIPHRAAVNFLWSMRDRPGLAADDVLLAVTTLSFDIAVLELYLPLLVGARVVIAEADIATDGAQLAALLETSGATVMQATPATWRMLLAAGWENGSGLRKALCGGEALTPDLAAALLERDVELWNMYGPTEATVWSTTCQVASPEPPISIGRPIANTKTYILDGNLEPVPVGVVGELYIGGDGVAHGYLNRPQLTAERFLHNPFVTSFGANGRSREATPDKMYRTGDLARYLPGGDLLFLGRRDHQVKVRGFRIELGDVEAALAEHPAVRQGVVVAQGSGEERRLAAYVVLREVADAPTAGAWRRFLLRRLPDYMVPATFTTLDEFPLTPNNKVDRRALPDPEPSQTRLDTPFVPPRNALEERLADLCAQTLGWKANGHRRPDGRSTIGIHDNFFDLGGNSLLATRLIFQVREQFQVQIPLRYLFAEPTVAGLAKAVEAGQSSAGDDDRWKGGWRKSVEELNAEAVLDPAITAGAQSFEFPAEPDHVFLTGATGFVGAFLLRDLLAQTEAAIVCLVRADDEAAGRQRLRQNMERYGLWCGEFDERIMVVCGDLGQPRLALSEEDFRELAQKVDAIYHNGAMVNFVYPYEAHKAANVLGTQEVLRLAAAGSLKPVHFVSTLSVFHTGGHDDGAIFTEDDDLDAVGAPFGGYAQSKWVAEKLVMEAGRRGVPVAIYRPGLVTGDSETGAWNSDDMMSTMARACLATGAVPDLDVMVDVVPVDFVSGSIVQLSLQPASLGQTFHLANPEPMPYRELVSWVRSLGLPLEIVPFDEWRRRLFTLAAKADGHGAEAFLPLLEEVTAEQVFMPPFDCRRTLEGLADSDVVCPPVGPALLRTYLAHLGRQEILPAPVAEAQE